MAEEYAASERAEKDFANRKGKWKVVFRKHSRKQGTVSVTKDAYKISWALENAEKVKAEETGTNAVLYPDILPGNRQPFLCKRKEHKRRYHPENTGSNRFFYMALSYQKTSSGTSVYIPVRYAMMVITDFADVYTTPKVSAETKITSIFKNECVVAMASERCQWKSLVLCENKERQKGYVRSESLCIYMPGGSASNSACTAVENASPLRPICISNTGTGRD